MEYLKHDDGTFVRFATGKKIPLDHFDDEPSEKAKERVDQQTIQERIANIEKLGVPVPQHLLDELYEEEGPSLNIKGK